MVKYRLRVVAMNLALAMVQAARPDGRKKGLVGSYVVGNYDWARSLGPLDSLFENLLAASV